MTNLIFFVYGLYKYASSMLLNFCGLHHMKFDITLYHVTPCMSMKHYTNHAVITKGLITNVSQIACPKM